MGKLLPAQVSSYSSGLHACKGYRVFRIKLHFSKTDSNGSSTLTVYPDTVDDIPLFHSGDCRLPAI